MDKVDYLEKKVENLEEKIEFLEKLIREKEEEHKLVTVKLQDKINRMETKVKSVEGPFSLLKE